MVKKGFSVLELVVSIFLLTVVIGTGILIIAGNLNIIKKSNETLIAAAIAQYHIELARTIDFPPVCSDRQSEFPKKIAEDTAFDSSYQVSSLDPSFNVFMGCVWYKDDGSEETDENKKDSVVLRKIKIEVKRSKDNYLLIAMPVYITRNGIY